MLVDEREEAEHVEVGEHVVRVRRRHVGVDLVALCQARRSNAQVALLPLPSEAGPQLEVDDLRSQVSSCHHRP